MATVYELKTFADIYNAILEEVKIQSGDTSTLNRIKRDINIIYQDEVCSFERWKWLYGSVDITKPAAITDSSVAVTQNDTDVTMTTAPAIDVTGWNFSVNGESETYRIGKHTASSTAIELEAPYTGSSKSAASVKIWRPWVPLPSDVRETIEISHDFLNDSMEGIGIQEYRKLVSTAPKAEGRPKWYSTSNWIDPDPYDSIGSLPALSTRASSGLVKTLVYASDVSSLLKVGDKIRVSACPEDTYNGEYTISSVATTTATYTGTSALTEGATADAALALELKNQAKHWERYRQLLVHPAIFDQKTTLHVDHIKHINPLVEDSDEPLMPIGDRVILVYGALSRAWARERNPEESQRNAALFERKLAQMSGKLEDSTDYVQLTPSKNYLASKRFSRGGRVTGMGALGSDWGGSGSGGGGATPTGTASRAAIFGADGLLKADDNVSTTELGYLDTVGSQVVGISDTNTLTNKSIDSDNNTITNIVNADIKAAAGIEMSKLEALTASRVVVTNGSGVLSVGGVTSPTEISYLDDVEPLTTVALNDNQAAADDVATWAHADFKHVTITFSIVRGSGNRETGTIQICTDGTSAGISTTSASIGTIGVTFSADISGTDLRLRYTSTSTGTAPTMAYTLQKWGL